MSRRNRLTEKRSRREARLLRHFWAEVRHLGWWVEPCVHCGQDYFGFAEHDLCICCVGAAVGHVLTLAV